MKLIYLSCKDQLPLKIKDIFTTNESVNPYNTRGGKLIFITHTNITHCDVKSLRYNGPVIWNDFFRNTNNNNNLFNTSISKFKHYLKDLLISQYLQRAIYKLAVFNKSKYPYRYSPQFFFFYFLNILS